MNAKTKLNIEDDFKDKQTISNEKKMELLLKRIAELEDEKGKPLENGKMIYGNQNEGKLWGKRIHLSRGNAVYKDFPYVIFGDGINPDIRVEFGKPIDVPLGIFETIKNHEKYVTTYKVDPQTRKATTEINDINVHYRCEELGDVYK